MSNSNVTTDFLILSETYGLIPDYSGEFRKPLPSANVLIHAGNMTSTPIGEKLTLESFKNQIKWIINAEMELKILVAGEHDTFWDGDAEEDEKIWEYLNSAEVKEAGVVLLNEECQQFHLRNGAVFTVQALTIKKSTSLSNACDRLERPQIIISHCPLSKDYTDALDCAQVHGHLSSIQLTLNIYNHRAISWGAQIISWQSKNTNSTRKIRAEQQIKEDKYTGEKFVDLRIFGKALEQNETMMINAGVFQDEVHRVRPVMLVSLECRYKEVVEFVGMGKMISPTTWGKWDE